MKIETWFGAPDGGVHAGQWCCDTSAIYRKKRQTWCSREAKKIMFIHYFQLHFSSQYSQGSLTEQMNIQTCCGPAPYSNKVFKRTQLHLLPSDIFYLSLVKMLIADSVTKSSSLRCYWSNISAEPLSQNILEGILSQTSFTL